MKRECEILRDLLNASPDAYRSTDEISEMITARMGIEITPDHVNNCLISWKNKLYKLYEKLYKHDELVDEPSLRYLTDDPEKNWDIVNDVFERTYGLRPMFYQKLHGLHGILGEYIKPDFSGIQEIETIKLVHQIRGIGTQVKKMHLVGIKPRLTGTDPSELLADARNFEVKLLNGEVNEKKYKTRRK